MPDDLRQALDALGLSDLFDVLQAQDVEADMLDDLTEASLIDIGLTLGQRTRFQRAIKARKALLAPQAERAATGRRQLTALFCDLVGSTRLSTLLDPEDLRDVFNTYQGTAAEVMRAHRGHIAYSQGDGLMVYFGFPVAEEDDPERALRAGLELAERISSLRTAAPEPLQVRIGIATGIVVVADGEDPAHAGSLVVGETPNLAARLQSAAAPGEVVISESSRRICGAMFEYEARGAFEFKGFDDPVLLHRVIGESRAGRFVGHTAEGVSPMVGREGELSALRRLWQSARSGQGGVALIGGEPGIGKSRLAHAFLAELDPGAQLILTWHAAAHLVNRPLHPVVREVEASAGLTRDMDEAARAAALDAWVQLSPGVSAADLPWFGDLLGVASLQAQGMDPQGRARRVQDAVLRRFEGLALDRPVVLLIEDLHWADAATIELLSALIPRLAALPMLVILTHRPQFTPRWDLPESAVQLVLEGIDQSEALRLTRQVAGAREIPPRLAEAIVLKAGGVPLFVEELTKTLLEGDLSAAGPVGGAGAAVIPATLQDSLMGRLDRMGDAKQLAQLASVIGRDFSADMLRMIAPPDVDVMAGLRRLCEAGLTLVQGSDGVEAYAFHHALIQDTAYESLLKSRRRDIHRHVAQRILDGNAAFARTEPEITARHCAVAGMDEPAARYWILAGTQAADRAASHAAATCLTEALQHLDKLPPGADRTRAELQAQMALAPAYMSVHGWASPQAKATSQRALDLALEVGDPAAEFGTRWMQWTTYLLGGQVAETYDQAQRLTQIAEASGAGWMALAAGHARSFALATMGRQHDVIAVHAALQPQYDAVQEQIALRGFQLSPVTSIQAIASQGYWLTGDPVTATRLRQEMMDRTDALKHLPNLAQAFTIASYQSLLGERWDEVAAICGRVLQVAQEEGMLFWQGIGQMSLAFCDPSKPEMAAGVGGAVIDQFIAMGSPLTMPLYEICVAKALLKLGNPAEADRRLSERIASAVERGEVNYIPGNYLMRGQARAALGDQAAASEDYDSALRLARKLQCSYWQDPIERSRDDLRALRQVHPAR